MNKLNCAVRDYGRRFAIFCLIIWSASLCSAETSNAEMLKRANRGDAEAQRIMGKRLFHGLNGAPVQRKNAIKWFKLAAEQGDAQALYILGELYENGVNVRQDLGMALAYYQQASAAGSRKAAEKLTQYPFNVSNENSKKQVASKSGEKTIAAPPIADVSVASNVLCRGEEGKKPLPLAKGARRLSGKCRFSSAEKVSVIIEDGREFWVDRICDMEDETVEIARAKAQEATGIDASAKWSQIADFVESHDYCSDPILLCSINAVVRWGSDVYATKYIRVTDEKIRGISEQFLSDPDVAQTNKKNIMKLQETLEE